MEKIYKILGKRGRITIPYELRLKHGFAYNDVVSFEETDKDTIVISRKVFGENLDEILEKVEKENIGYVIHDEGSKDLVLCPARWYSYCFDENFGDMLICAVHGAIEFQGNAFDFVCAFIRKHLPVIDITSLEHLAMSIEDLMKVQTDEHKLTTGRLILDDIHRQIEDIKNAHKGK